MGSAFPKDMTRPNPTQHISSSPILIRPVPTPQDRRAGGRVLRRNPDCPPRFWRQPNSRRSPSIKKIQWIWRYRLRWRELAPRRHGVTGAV